MKSKGLFSFIFVIVLALLLVGCKSNKVGYDDTKGDDGGVTVGEVNNSTPDRKIIYKVSASLSTDNLSESLLKIKNELNDDEWLDSETISDSHASLVIRVKTEHLDEFLNMINDGHKVLNFSKTASDVSLTYQDKSDLLLSYQTERVRLLELYEQAALSEMIQINSRLAEIDIEIAKLNGELKQFDSLVEYSEVRLNLSTQSVADVLPFGERITNAFSDGFGALVVFLETLVLILATLLPWMIILAPVGVGVYFLQKRINKIKVKPSNNSKDNKNN